MVPLPRLAVHAPPLTADIVAPTVGILGQPFALHLLLRNGSATVQGLQVNIDHPSVGLWLQQQAAAQRQAQAGATPGSDPAPAASAAQAAAARLRPTLGILAVPPPSSQQAAGTRGQAAAPPLSAAAAGLPLAVLAGPMPHTYVQLRPGDSAVLSWLCVAHKRGCIPLPCITVRALGPSAQDAATGQTTAVAAAAVLAGAQPAFRPAADAAAMGVSGPLTASSLLLHAALASAGSATPVAPPRLASHSAALSSGFAPVSASELQLPRGHSAPLAAGAGVGIVCGATAGPLVAAGQQPGVFLLPRDAPAASERAGASDEAASAASSVADASAAAGSVAWVGTHQMPAGLRPLEPPLCVIGGPLRPPPVTATPPFAGGPVAAEGIAVEPQWLPMLPLLVE
jgi:hypothetical protein